MHAHGVRGTGGGGGVPKRRDRRSVALVVVGGLLLNLAALCLWSWRSFASSQGFADVATDMLKEPAVRESVARQIVDAIEDQAVAGNVVIAARPLIEQVVEEMVGTTAFRGIFHASVRQVHASVFAGHRTRLLVPVDDAAEMVAEGLRVVSPDLADALPDTAITLVVGISQSQWVERGMSAASLAGWLAGPLAVAGVAAFVLGVRGASDRRRGVEWVGLCLFLSGVAIFTLLFIGLQLVASMGDDPTARTALRAVFWSATHVLNIEAKVFILTGAVLWVAAADAAPGEVRARLHSIAARSRAIVARPAWRLVCCSVLLLAGLFAMSWPAASAAILVRVLAFGAFVTGAVGILDLAGSYQEARADRVERRRRLPVFAAESTALIVLVPIALAGGAFAITRAVQPAGATAPRPDVAGCNGHVELCDRRLDQVVLAGTHNSMSAARERGWSVPNQRGGIGAQLASGVRALMLDLHYGWAEAGGVVRTDVRSEANRDQPDDVLTADARATVDRLLAFFGAAPPEDEHDVYLCHIYCEAGATPARTALRGIADFLRENPNEVLLILVEDHVEAADAVQAFERSGLARRAWTWTPGQPLPTLRQMIEARRNVLVLAEYGGGAAPWYHDAFGGLLVETGYKFASVDDFSCALNRGEPSHPLFLVNHWINAGGINPAGQYDTINGKAVLGARLERCQRELGRLPNIVAVDFYSRGDLFELVDELNRVSTPPIREAAAPDRSNPPE